MRRGEADAFQTVNFMNGFEQLDKSGPPFAHGHVPFAVARDNLAEQGDFPHAARNQFAALGYDVGNRPAAFFAPRVRHDAKSAVLVAALHDADKRATRKFWNCR